MYERRIPWMTYLVLAILIIVFVGEIVTGNGTITGSLLYQQGAEYAPLIKLGQYWRLLTAVFLHMNLLHIAGNAFCLWYIGMAVEYTFGHFQALLIFLLTGIAGDAACYYMTPMAITVGASGAIFGLFGAYLIFCLQDWDDYRGNFMNCLYCVVFNFVIDLSTPGIATWGHAGGLLSGIIIAIVLCIFDNYHREK